MYFVDDRIMRTFAINTHRKLAKTGKKVIQSKCYLANVLYAGFCIDPMSLNEISIIFWILYLLHAITFYNNISIATFYLESNYIM